MIFFKKFVCGPDRLNMNIKKDIISKDKESANEQWAKNGTNYQLYLIKNIN